MRTGIFALAVSLGYIVMVYSAVAQKAQTTTYYFPQDKVCTVLVDFQKQREDIERLSDDQGWLRLIHGLVDEFAANGGTKCAGTDLARMMAVYIPGVDNYGRPDFPNRINLVRVDGTPAQFYAAAKLYFTSLEQIKSTLAVTIIDKKH